MIGWIKLHRQILEWEWYSDNNTFRLFLHLLLKANHKEKRYKGLLLQSGSILTSRDILAIETGLSVRQVRTALTRLNSTNELTIKTSTQGTIIHIVNYQKYQIESNEMTNERPTNDQQTTTNKNDKKEKNIFIKPSLQEVLEYCTERNNKIDANQFINFYDSKGWMVGRNKMKDWKASIRTWEKQITSQDNKVKSLDEQLYENVMKQLNLNK
jgi:hypothetical protein